MGAVGGIVVLALFVTMLASEQACHAIGGWLQRPLRFLPPAADQRQGDSEGPGRLADRGRCAARRVGRTPQATAGVVLYSLYVHFLEVPLGALGRLAWWSGPNVSPAQPQGGSSSTTSGTKT